MNELAADGVRIDADRVRWSVDGLPADAAAARDALASGRPLLLLMHGYGSFEGDLIELSPGLPAGFVCASPRAPLTAPPPVVDGYAWFPISFDPSGATADDDGAPFLGSAPHRAALAVLDWLDALDASLRDASGAAGGADIGSGDRTAAGLGTVALMGFSQGGAMVTSLLRLRPERFACGVICSGFVPAGAFSGDAALAAVRPPVFWGFDPDDPVIDRQRIARAAEWLPAHTELDRHVYAGIAHSISRNELTDIAAFLQRETAAVAARAGTP